MVADQRLAARLLLLNPGAGSLTPELQRKIRDALPDFRVVLVEQGQDIVEAYDGCPTTDDALVAVAGGDGSVEAVAHRLAGTRRALGIIPLGTFNNFARSLGLPADAEAAVRVIRTGVRTAVTLGTINGQHFLEAAAVGLFGEAIALGEVAKERRFGELGDRLRRVVNPEGFRYQLSGDVDLHGRATSIVFANTPRIGAHLEIAATDPTQPKLELWIRRERGRLELAWRLLSAFRAGPAARRARHRIRRVTVETWPPMAVYADAKEVGTAPAAVEAQPAALWVILPG